MPGTTVKDQEVFVGDLIDKHWIQQGRTMDELIGIVGKAFNESGVFPKTAEEDDAPKNPKSGTDA